jgi:hypothetical protein
MSTKRPKTRPPFDPDSVSNSLDFDSLEERIRGEDLILDTETRKSREAADVKKKLDAGEVDRRLAELKKKIGKKK